MPNIRVMTLADYDAVLDLMHNTPGISLRDADSRESTARYLERNPGMSFIAEVDGMLCACVMCGHDGRRGYLQHLLVLPDYRRQGLANALVARWWRAAFQALRSRASTNAILTCSRPTTAPPAIGKARAGS